MWKAYFNDGHGHISAMTDKTIFGVRLSEVICFLPNWGHNPKSLPTIKSQAHLIAAAPDLLEALERC